MKIDSMLAFQGEFFMKSFEIYFKDLNAEAQARLLKEFSTTEQDENWDVFPITVIDREEETAG